MYYVERSIVEQRIALLNKPLSADGQIINKLVSVAIVRIEGAQERKDKYFFALQILIIMEFDNIVFKTKMASKYPLTKTPDRTISKLIRNLGRPPRADQTQLQEFIIVKNTTRT